MSLPPERKLPPPEKRLRTESPPSNTVRHSSETNELGNTTARSSPSEPSVKLDYLWHVHEYINEYIRFGDAKAAFAGTIASGLLAALYTSLAHSQFLQLPHDRWSTSTWLAIGAAIFLGTSVVLALWTVRPRLQSTQSRGFIFWGNIANHKNIEDLQSSFYSQSEQNLNDHLLRHLFDLSKKICVPKYRSTSLCVAALCLGAFLAGVALTLQAPAASSTNQSTVGISSTTRQPDSVNSRRTTDVIQPSK